MPNVAPTSDDGRGWFLPGLLIASLYVGYVIIRALLDPSIAPSERPERHFRDYIVALGNLLPLGVLMGTAYLLTREAVSTGAIGKSYQERLLKSGHTDVLDSGNGYEVRTAPGPFTETFEKEKNRMQKGRGPI